jgi:hypothetical protein
LRESLSSAGPVTVSLIRDSPRPAGQSTIPTTGTKIDRRTDKRICPMFNGKIYVQDKRQGFTKIHRRQQSCRTNEGNKGKKR